MYRLLILSYALIATNDVSFANLENVMQVEYTSQSNSTLLNDSTSLTSLNENMTAESMSESILNIEDDLVIFELDNVTPVDPNTIPLEDMIIIAKSTNEYIATQVSHSNFTLQHEIFTNEHTSPSPLVEVNGPSNNKTSPKGKVPKL
jgi:hypothetical protein